MMKKLAKNKKLLGYSPAAISLWETGKRPVSWPLAAKLEKLFPKKKAVQWKEAKHTVIKKVFDKIRAMEASS